MESDESIHTRHLALTEKMLVELRSRPYPQALELMRELSDKLYQRGVDAEKLRIMELELGAS